METPMKVGISTAVIVAPEVVVRLPDIEEQLTPVNKDMGRAILAVLKDRDVSGVLENGVASENYEKLRLDLEAATDKASSGKLEELGLSLEYELTTENGQLVLAVMLNNKYYYPTSILLH
jgi:hypothetical protein